MNPAEHRWFGSSLTLVAMSAIPNQKRRSHLAMTLVEMLVVIAVIALLMGLVASGAIGLNRSRVLKSEAEKVAGVLEEARGVALAGNTMVEVTFTEGTITTRRFKSAWAYREGGGAGTFEESRLKLGWTVIPVQQQPLIFYPGGGVYSDTGAPIRSREFRVVPADRRTGADYFKIIVRGLTGQVELRNPETESVSAEGT